MGRIQFEQVTTRGGDRGESSLADGERRRKDDLFFHTLGTIDELSSQLGFVRALMKNEPRDMGDLLLQKERGITLIQENLQKIAGMIAVPRRSPLFEKLRGIENSDIVGLEKMEQRLMEGTEIPVGFIQPGDSTVSASLHVARAVCRRTERWVVSCIRDRGLDYLASSQQYLNRLGDFLFVCALRYDQREGDNYEQISLE